MSQGTIRQPAQRPQNSEDRVGLGGAIGRYVEGHVYATLADKVAAVNAFLDELDADPPRVRSLCGWDWINAALATLPEPLENAA